MPAPEAARAEWTCFATLVEQLPQPRLAEYLPQLDRLHDNAPTRRVDLEQLQQLARGCPSRERFLTEPTLDPPDATSDHADVPRRRAHPPALAGTRRVCADRRINRFRRVSPIGAASFRNLSCLPLLHPRPMRPVPASRVAVSAIRA
ncbi:MAG: hypothetical protein Q4G71_04850 [Pseudomonadota bacterium]|nr:hypothetical protein [Pseudomonadota bacterium]